MTGTTRIANISPDILSFLNSAPSSFSSGSFSTAVPPYALVDEPLVVEIKIFNREQAARVLWRTHRAYGCEPAAIV